MNIFILVDNIQTRGYEEFSFCELKEMSYLTNKLVFSFMGLVSDGQNASNIVENAVTYRRKNYF